LSTFKFDVCTHVIFSFVQVKADGSLDYIGVPFGEY
jgi:hypothetical protein